LSGAPDVIHGTAIALDGRAALICGPSGSGKSDLALRCLTQAPNPLIKGEVRLVADDYTAVAVKDGAVYLSAPKTIRDKLEVRGVGIVNIPAIDEARLVLIAELVGADQIERLPDPIPQRNIAGVTVPVLQLAAFEASTPSKLLLALSRLSKEKGGSHG